MLSPSEHPTPSLKIGDFKQGLSFLMQIPTEQLYRLYVDGYKLAAEKGPMQYDTRYENEGGSNTHNKNEVLKALQGLQTIVQHGVDELSTGSSELHIPNSIIQKTRGRIMRKNDWGQDMFIEAMDGSGGFGVSPNTVSEQGLRQLLQRMADPNEKGYKHAALRIGDYQINSSNALEIPESEIPNILVSLKYNGGFLCTSDEHEHEPDEDFFSSMMETYTAKFSDEFAATKKNGDVDQMIRIIVDYVQRCEQLHPFGDGNSRTFVNSLMCYCLMQAGLPPVIFERPAVVDMHSVDELVAIVKQGCFNTLDLIQGQNTIHGFNHAQMMEQHQEKADPHLHQIIMQSYDVKEHLHKITSTLLETKEPLLSEEQLKERRQYHLESLRHEIKHLSELLSMATGLEQSQDQRENIKEILHNLSKTDNVELLAEEKMGLYDELSKIVEHNLKFYEEKRRQPKNATRNNSMIDSNYFAFHSLKLALEERISLGKHYYAGKDFFTFQQNHLNESITSEVHERLKSTTQTYLGQMNKKNSNYVLVTELHKILTETHPNELSITRFYNKLAESSPLNPQKTNIELIKNNRSKSTKNFILEIVTIAAIVVTGIIPGVMIMAATKKWPSELFESYSNQFKKQIDKNVNVLDKNVTDKYKRRLMDSKIENEIVPEQKITPGAPT